MPRVPPRTVALGWGVDGRAFGVVVRKGVEGIGGEEEGRRDRIWGETVDPAPVGGVFQNWEEVQGARTLGF